MAAYGTKFGSLRAILKVSAVAAIPNLYIVALENFAVLDVLGELNIALLM